jgi:hypothetical protein
MLGGSAATLLEESDAAPEMLRQNRGSLVKSAILERRWPDEYSPFLCLSTAALGNLMDARCMVLVAEIPQPLGSGR